MLASQRLPLLIVILFGSVFWLFQIPMLVNCLFILGFIWLWAAEDKRIFTRITQRKYRYSFLRVYCGIFEFINNQLVKREVKSGLSPFFLLLPLFCLSLALGHQAYAFMLFLGGYLHFVLNLLIKSRA